jgi:hypothetical protein
MVGQKVLSKPSADSFAVGQRQKRYHSGKLPRTLAESFMENENVALKGIAWTLKEELLLMEIVGKDKKK